MSVTHEIIDVEPVNPAHADVFDVEQTHNCIGQDVYIYHLAQTLSDSVLQALMHWGSAYYPLGKNCGVAKLDSPGHFSLSGIIGGRELRITLRNAAPKGTRAAFETDLAKASQSHSDQPI